MLHWYRAMRIAPLALAALAGIGCRRGSLQGDAGTGVITSDAAPGDVAPGDGPRRDGLRPDLPGLGDARTPSADANCGMSSIMGRYLAPELLVVLDRSIAVDPTPWNDFLSGLAATITSNAFQIDWGLYAFPTDGPACGAGTISTAIDVAPTPGDGLIEIAHIVAAGRGASGTPAAAAIDVAAAYMLSRTTATANAKYLVLVTDGAPTCAGRTGASLSVDPAQAQADAVAAISAASAMGIPTIVVAPSTTTSAGDIDALNALAVAGRYPRPSAGPQFMTESTFGELFARADFSGSCVFNLTGRPPVPDDVSVILDGRPVPRAPSSTAGWNYTDAAATAIELHGSWCEMLLSSRTFDLNVYYGCPSADDGL